MKLHSKSQNYEQAANLRDRIKALSKITSERYSDLNSDEDFDIIFLDPPYKEKDIRILLEIIKQKQFLKKNGIILIHREKTNLDIYPTNFKILINKIYGRSKIIFGKFD